jgi:16S rRNA G966 N2-methylase RsmD
MTDLTIIILFFIAAIAGIGLLSYGTIYGAMYMKIPTRKLKKVMELCKLKPETNVMDLGAGMGAFTFEAANTGATVTAVEIDPVKVLIMKLLLKQNNAAASAAAKTGVQGAVLSKAVNFWTVNIVKANLLKVDYSNADVIYCYLSPPLMQAIGEKAQKEMKTGSKIISVEHRINSLEPTFEDSEDKIYEYTF